MAVNPSAASTLAKDEPTIRFATEAGAYPFAFIQDRTELQIAWCAGLRMLMMRILPSRCPHNPSPHSRPRRLREGYLLCPGHRSLTPLHALLPHPEFR